jgi:hypothetical protein
MDIDGRLAALEVFDLAARALTKPRGAYAAPAERLRGLLRVLRPGDMIPVDGDQRISEVIKYLTQSTWSHSVLYVGDEILRRFPGQREALVSTHGRDSRHMIVEALMEGVVASPLAKYASFNLRICRPASLRHEDLQRVLDEILAQLGVKYDVKNVVDLARYFFPVSLIPRRLRRKALQFGSGLPTQVICSSLIGRAFQNVGFPILPTTTLALGAARPPSPRPRCAAPALPGALPPPAPSIITPRDFDPRRTSRSSSSTGRGGRFDYRRIAGRTARRARGPRGRVPDRPARVTAVRRAAARVAESASAGGAARRPAQERSAVAAIARRSRTMSSSSRWRPRARPAPARPSIRALPDARPSPRSAGPRRPSRERRRARRRAARRARRPATWLASACGPILPGRLAGPYMTSVRGRSLAGGILLALLAGALFFSGLDRYPLFDPDEARHAEVAREMYESRGIRARLLPTLDHRPYREKPPSYYWLVGLAYHARGVDEAAPRAVSALAGLIGVLAVYVWALPRFESRARSAPACDRDQRRLARSGALRQPRHDAHRARDGRRARRPRGWSGRAAPAALLPYVAAGLGAS